MASRAGTLNQKQRTSGDQTVRLALIGMLVAATALAFVGRVPFLLRAAIFGTVCVLIVLAKRLRPAMFQPPKPHVEVDAEGVRRIAGDKVIESVGWDSLVKVSIVTTEDGPSIDDMFFLLHAADGTGCVVGSEQAGEVDLLAHLQRLPRFKNMAVIEASGSTTRAEFLCWEGSPGEGLAAVEPHSYKLN